ncbi:MAG: alpha/beta fold hydrolase [Oleiphilaceae bacterium]|nr:alpha/beta fold hydrolase [Oleiphilaceae bacterium]
MSVSKADFRPFPGLKNRHVQSILASAKWRIPLMRTRLLRMLEHSQDEIWSDGEGTLLHSLYARQSKQRSRGLVVLIHGWEGSHKSVYMRSAASACFEAGYDVICLNLRDHGPSHAFNEGLFNASRLPETVGVLSQILLKTDYTNYALVGFSLGGNFALRCAAAFSSMTLPKCFAQVLAVCPVVDPAHTFSALNLGPAVYRKYFIKKWKRSLNEKSVHFPHLIASDTVAGFKTLDAMTERLVKEHTEFTSVEAYFESYRLAPAMFNALNIPSTILWSKDDPVIPHVPEYKDFASEMLRIELSERGGHCGFIKDYRLNSYVDSWLLNKLANQNH